MARGGLSRDAGSCGDLVLRPDPRKIPDPRLRSHLIMSESLCGPGSIPGHVTHCDYSDYFGLDLVTGLE